MVANSGGSNTGDGERGLATARAMQARTAELLGVEADQVGVASTGVIGSELPREQVLTGIEEACRALGPDADDLSRAILTSDSGPKRACLEVELEAGPVRVAAQAKGAGHDLAALRHDVLLPADRRRAGGGHAGPAHRACA